MLSQPLQFRTLLAVCLLVLILPVRQHSNLSAQIPPDLKKYETSSARLVFLDKNISYLVPHTVRTLENALLFHKEFWDYEPTEKTSILFNDFSDVGNGGTMVMPWNFLNIGVSPFDYTFSVVPSNERMQWLMNHELAHQVMCDKSVGRDNFYRKLLVGKVLADNTDPISMVYSYLSTPRWYSPRWYQEGIAVFMETWMSGGIGRVIGGYDEMVFRTMVHDSAYIYSVVGLETEGTTIDFQVGVNAYLYGTRFVSYLAHEYGPDKLREFYSRTDSSKRFFGQQFRNVYGKSVQAEWDRWIGWEKSFQKKNLQKIKEFPDNPFRSIVPQSLGSASRQHYNASSETLYIAVNHPGKMARIVAIHVPTGAMHTIAQVPSPGLFNVTSLAYDDSSKTIFAATQNKDWRGLQSIDAQTGKITELMRFTRAGHLVIDPETHDLWGIQSISGRTALLRFPPPYTQYETVTTLPFGQDFSDPAISPDGSLLSVTLSDASGKQKIVLYPVKDLLQGKTGYRELYEFEDNPAANFVFSPDGRYLYGTSYYTGVSNVFRIPVDSGDPQILTNAATGYFRPLPVSTDSMVVLKYTHEGMVVGMMKINPLDDVNAISYLGQQIHDRYPEVENWSLPSPTRINLDSMKIEEKDYHPVREMRLAGAYPIIQGYKNHIAAGYRFDVMDPMALSHLKLKLSFSPGDSLPRNQKPHASAEFRFWNWTFNGNYNYADFYDLFGPTKFSRAGYSFSTKYYRIINRLSPHKTDFFVRLSVYGGLETLPGNQNIASDYRNLFVGTVNFHKSYLRKSLGAIEPEQGYDWNLYAFSSFAKNVFYPQLISNQDFGVLLPFRNTSLWMRTSVGQSFGDPDKSNSKFYFGGFGNNYLEYRMAQQYREMSSFPGMEIDAIPALNYGKVTAELNLRPVRFKKLGFNGIYSTYARLSLFGMGLFTNIGYDPGPERYFAAGAQIDLEVVLFSLLKTTLSAGYSKAGQDGLSHDQFMFSLKF